MASNTNYKPKHRKRVPEDWPPSTVGTLYIYSDKHADRIVRRLRSHRPSTDVEHLAGLDLSHRIPTQRGDA